MFHILVEQIKRAKPSEREELIEAAKEKSVAFRKIFEKTSDKGFVFVLPRENVSTDLQFGAGFNYHVDYVAKTVAKDFFCPVGVDDPRDPERVAAYFARLLSGMSESDRDALLWMIFDMEAPEGPAKKEKKSGEDKAADEQPEAAETEKDEGGSEEKAPAKKRRGRKARKA